LLIHEDREMTATSGGRQRAFVPRRRQRHYSYNESLDEPAKLIADEPVEVEEEAPAEENESVEGTRENDRAEPPAFEE
jgi:hypothetical protein